MTMRKLLFLLTLSLLPLVANAEAVEIDGIYYYLVDEVKTAEVTSNPNKYSGSIVIPESVTYKGVSYSVTIISDYAFGDCSGLTSVSIPNSVTYIGGDAFYNCSGLTYMEIPNSVTYIGDRAFYGCSSLTSMTIPNSVTSIEDAVFCECSSLNSVTIGNGVTSIGIDAFEHCSDLVSVIVESGNTTYDSRDNCNAIIETSTNTLIAGCKNSTIPNSVTSIGDYAFENCKGLTSIIIGNNVISIGLYAFAGCCDLSSVTIPNSVTSMYDSFQDCTSLTSVTIPGSVKSIGGTFKNCTNLTSVTILNGVSDIGNEAFYNCSSLSSITIPESVISIGTCAFCSCASLNSITIGNSVSTIGDAAFDGCISLTSISIPNSVTFIGKHAFSGCSGLTSITIGNGVTSFGERVFYCCNSLASVYISDLMAWLKINFVDSESNPLCFAHNLYLNGKKIEKLVIPDNVLSIGKFALVGCSGLTSVTIGNSVTTIGNSAFSECSGITSVLFGNNVTTIERGAFGGCSSLVSVTIPSSVTSIGEYAFRECSGLISVTIPSSVTFIGENAFYNCCSLISVTIPNSITSINRSVFEDCSGLTSVIIGNSVTTIERGAFGGCNSLVSVTIPNNVVSIGEVAFSGCSSLTSVIIEDGVTTISDGAFYGCDRLSLVTIPNSVTTIGRHAFGGISNLSDVYCLATEVPLTGYDAFLRNYLDEITHDLSQVTLHVPKGCVEKYAAVEPWNYFGKIVEIIDDADLFPDCPAGEIRDAAIYLYHKGIVEGEDGKLYVDREATRAEVAKTSFYGAYFGPMNVPAELGVDNYPSVYSDLQDKSTYYYRPAKALLYLEYGDGVTPFDRNRLAFEPEEKIARVNVLKELLETFNIQPDLEGTANPFPKDADVVAIASSNPVKMGYIRKAAALGIITTANDEFRPYDNCTRGEEFLMLARIMQKIEASEIDDPKPQESDYFEPLNTTLKTISLGASLQMGNFQHYTKTSFALSGVVPLAFAHTYNSYNTTLSSVFFGDKSKTEEDDSYQPLGDGWSHNYHSFLTVVGDYQKGAEDNGLRAIVHWGGGSIDVYKSDGSRIIPESMGVYDEFSFKNDEVLIKSKSQMEYRFSKQGGTGSAVFYLYRIKDRNGNELTINYEDGQNGNKRISSVSDGNRLLKFSYLSGTDLLSEVKDPLNRSVKFGYFDNQQTGKKQLKNFTDAEGNTTTYEYADLSNVGTSKLLSRIQLPKGNYVENEYDANRRLKSSESGVNGVPTTKTSVSVTANYGSGAVSTQSQVDVERGSLTSSYNYTYNENNVVTGMTGANNMFVNGTYGDAAHPELPTSIQNNKTDVSDITYDERGNVTSITVSGEGTLTTTLTYDEMNNVTSVTDPKGNKTEYSYDANGNLTGISAPEGVTTAITVDGKGLPVESSNAMGVKTQYDYNEYGNLIKTTLPALGLSSSAAYDAASRLVKAIDALGRTSSYVYNDNDYLTSETDAMKHTTNYEYDANDNLTGITNAKGGVTTMTYDNATDWLLSVEFAGAKKEYDYNKDGTLNSFTKPDGTTLSYSYDELGRITNDGINDYSYDDKLRLSSVSDGSKSISFEYDGFNRITGTNCDGIYNNYSYDKNGNCTSINDTEYGYDGLNRLTSVSFSGGTISYTYRKDSQLSKVEYPNGMTTTYGYDEVGRLTSKQTKLSNGTVVAGYSYVLDKVGNITEQTTQEPYTDIVLPEEEVSYSYNDGNRITKAGDISFSFDANGNTTKRGSESYSWDKKDRLTAAGSTSITYDPLGLIASYGDISFTTDPLGIGNVLSDSKSGAEYIYGNGLEARVKDGKASYYVTDVRGSVVAIVDEDGNITHKYQYDDFGKVTQKEEADYNPFQYVGKYGVMVLNDHQYYMRARHYDPTIGRFLSEDPIWSTNLYPYADNNPIMGIDPEGMYTEKEKSYYIYEWTMNYIEEQKQLLLSHKIDIHEFKRLRAKAYENLDSHLAKIQKRELYLLLHHDNSLKKAKEKDYTVTFVTQDNPPQKVASEKDTDQYSYHVESSTIGDCVKILEYSAKKGIENGTAINYTLFGNRKNVIKK